MWNKTGDTLEFSIAQAYYQTTWFYASCVTAFLAMLWGLYRLRLYQVARESNAQVEGRVDERLRVARELHDTLLQSFQASLIGMQAARTMFARRPEKAVQSLDDAITMAAGAVAEGRIQNLRVGPRREAISRNCSLLPVRNWHTLRRLRGIHRSSALRWKGSGANWILCSRTRSTGSPANCCGTRTGTHKPAGSRPRSATRVVNSACTSATTEKESPPKS